MSLMYIITMSSDTTVKLKIRIYTLNHLGYKPQTCTFRIPSKNHYTYTRHKSTTGTILTFITRLKIQ